MYLRYFTCLVLLLLIVHCISGEFGGESDEKSMRKRFFGCSKAGKKCGGLFGKSCCYGYVCHQTFNKCVRKGKAISWLADRNGK